MTSTQDSKDAKPTPSPAPDKELTLDEFDDMLSREFRIPRNLLRGMIGVESSSSSASISQKGARGRYQVMPATFEAMKRKWNRPDLSLDNPYDISYVGARYLKELYEQSPKDPDERATWLRAVAKYHGGGADKEGRLSLASDGGITTAGHVDKVAKAWAELENLNSDPYWDPDKKVYNWDKDQAQKVISLIDPVEEVASGPDPNLANPDLVVQGILKSKPVEESKFQRLTKKARQPKTGEVVHGEDPTRKETRLALDATELSQATDILANVKAQTANQLGIRPDEYDTLVRIGALDETPYTDAQIAQIKKSAQYYSTVAGDKKVYLPISEAQGNIILAYKRGGYDAALAMRGEMDKRSGDYAKSLHTVTPKEVEEIESAQAEMVRAASFGQNLAGEADIVRGTLQAIHSIEGATGLKATIGQYILQAMGAGEPDIAKELKDISKNIHTQIQSAEDVLDKSKLPLSLRVQQFLIQVLSPATARMAATGGLGPAAIPALGAQAYLERPDLTHNERMKSAVLMSAVGVLPAGASPLVGNIRNPLAREFVNAGISGATNILQTGVEDPKADAWDLVGSFVMGAGFHVKPILRSSIPAAMGIKASTYAESQRGVYLSDYETRARQRIADGLFEEIKPSDPAEAKGARINFDSIVSPKPEPTQPPAPSVDPAVAAEQVAKVPSTQPKLRIIEISEAKDAEGKPILDEGDPVTIGTFINQNGQREQYILSSLAAELYRNNLKRLGEIKNPTEKDIESLNPDPLVLGMQDAEAKAKLAERQVALSMVPSPNQPEILYLSQGKTNLEVYKNPTSSDRVKMRKTYREDTYGRGGDEPIRTLYDAEGNEYSWPASKGLHDDIAKLLAKEGITEVSKDRQVAQDPEARASQPALETSIEKPHPKMFWGEDRLYKASEGDYVYDKITKEHRPVTAEDIAKSREKFNALKSSPNEPDFVTEHRINVQNSATGAQMNMGANLISHAIVLGYDTYRLVRDAGQGFAEWLSEMTSKVDSKLHPYLPDIYEKMMFLNETKVVDENGNPIKVYHGTRGSFGEFNVTASSYEPGTHFGTLLAAQEFTTNVAGDAAAPGANIRPVWLNIKNPLQVSDVFGRGPVTLMENLHLRGIVSAEEVRAIKEMTQEDFLVPDLYATPEQMKAVVDLVKSKGYDGFKYVNQAEDVGSTSWVVFSPDQILSTFEGWTPRNITEGKLPQPEKGVRVREGFTTSFLGVGALRKFNELDIQPYIRTIRNSILHNGNNLLATPKDAFAALVKASATTPRVGLELLKFSYNADKLLAKIGSNTHEYFSYLQQDRIEGLRDFFTTQKNLIGTLSDSDFILHFTRHSDTDWYDYLKALHSVRPDDVKSPKEIVDSLIAASHSGDYSAVRKLVESSFQYALDNLNTPFEGGRDKYLEYSAKPEVQEVNKLYAGSLGELLKTAHERSGGDTSEHLGPSGLYFPLISKSHSERLMAQADGTERKVPGISIGLGKRELGQKPSAYASHIATGLSGEYTTDVESVRRTMTSIVRRGDVADFIQKMEDYGIFHPAGVQRDPVTGGWKQIEPPEPTGYEFIPAGPKRSFPHKKWISEDVGIDQIFSPPQKGYWVRSDILKELTPLIESGKKFSEFEVDNLVGKLTGWAIWGLLEPTWHSWNVIKALQKTIPYIDVNTRMGPAVNTLLTGIANTVNPFTLGLLKTGYAWKKVFDYKLFTEKEGQDLGGMFELADRLVNSGGMPERAGKVTFSPKIARKTGAELVGPKQWTAYGKLVTGEKTTWEKVKTTIDFAPIIYGWNGLDIRARLAAADAIKRYAPDMPASEVFDTLMTFGIYNRYLESKFGQVLKRYQIAPFYSAASAGILRGKRSLLNPYGNMGHMIANAADTPDKAKLIASSLAESGYAYVVMWGLAHHQLTGKWPWDDDDARFLELPVPKWFRDTPTGKVLYPDPQKAAYFKMGINENLRGANSLGLQGLINTQLAFGKATGKVPKGSQLATSFQVGLFDALVGTPLRVGVTSSPLSHVLPMAIFGQKIFPRTEPNTKLGQGGLDYKFVYSAFSGQPLSVQRLGKQLIAGAWETNSFVHNLADGIEFSPTTHGIDNPAWASATRGILSLALGNIFSQPRDSKFTKVSLRRSVMAAKSKPQRKSVLAKEEDEE